MQADIYDFDKTIVPFDSETKFFFFCLKRYPWLLLYLPVMGIAWVLMELKIISFDKCKSTFTMFWAFVPHNGTIKKFWDVLSRCMVLLLRLKKSTSSLAIACMVM